MEIYQTSYNFFTYDFFFKYFSDVNELTLPNTCEIDFPDPDNLLVFKLIICPDEVSLVAIEICSVDRGNLYAFILKIGIADFPNIYVSLLI